MKHNEYLRKEWRDNKPVPMEESLIMARIKDQALVMRAAEEKHKNDK